MTQDNTLATAFDLAAKEGKEKVTALTDMLFKSRDFTTEMATQIFLQIAKYVRESIAAKDVQAAAALFLHAHRFAYRHDNQYQNAVTPVLGNGLALAGLYQAEGDEENTDEMALVQFRATADGASEHTQAADFLEQRRNHHIARKDFHSAEKIAVQIISDGATPDTGKAAQFLNERRDLYFKGGELNKAWTLQEYLCRMDTESKEGLAARQHLGVLKNQALAQKNPNMLNRCIELQKRFPEPLLSKEQCNMLYCQGLVEEAALKYERGDEEEKILHPIQEYISSKLFHEAYGTNSQAWADDQIKLMWKFLDSVQDDHMRNRNPEKAEAIMRWKLKESRLRHDDPLQLETASKGVDIAALYYEFGLLSEAVDVLELQIKCGTNIGDNRENAHHFLNTIADECIDNDFLEPAEYITDKQGYNYGAKVSAHRGLRLAQMYERRCDYKQAAHYAAVQFCNSENYSPEQNAAAHYLHAQTRRFIDEKNIDLAEYANLQARCCWSGFNSSSGRMFGSDDDELPGLDPKQLDQDMQNIAALHLAVNGPEKALQHAREITKEYHNSTWGYYQRILAAKIIRTCWDHYADALNPEGMKTVLISGKENKNYDPFQYMSDGSVEGIKNNRIRIAEIYLKKEEPEKALAEAQEIYTESFPSQTNLKSAWQFINARRLNYQIKGDKEKETALAQWQLKKSKYHSEHKEEIQAYFDDLKEQKESQNNFSNVLAEFIDNQLAGGKPEKVYASPSFQL